MFGEEGVRTRGKHGNGRKILERELAALRPNREASSFVDAVVTLVLPRVPPPSRPTSGPLEGVVGGPLSIIVPSPFLGPGVQKPLDHGRLSGAMGHM